MDRRFLAYHDVDGRRAAPGEALRFVAATEGVKRDGLDLRMSGAKLERFRSNPVLLLSHQYQSLPIGKVPQVWVEGQKLLIDAVFDQGDPQAREVERKYREGYLNAVSIGWETLKQTGRVVETWELLDVSCVAVPADPQALLLSRAINGSVAARAELVGILTRDIHRKLSQELESEKAELVRLKLLLELARLAEMVKRL